MRDIVGFVTIIILLVFIIAAFCVVIGLNWAQIGIASQVMVAVALAVTLILLIGLFVSFFRKERNWEANVSVGGKRLTVGGRSRRRMKV